MKPPPLNSPRRAHTTRRNISMFATVTIAVVSFGGRRRHLALLRVAVLAADERCARRLELLGAQRRLLVRARRDEAGEQEEDAEGRRLTVKTVARPSSLAPP